MTSAPLRLLATLLVALVALPSALGFSVKGRVKLPAGTPSTGLRVLLNDGQKEALVHADGTFELAGLDAGRYAVSVAAPALLYSTFKVELSSSGAVKAFEFRYPGAPRTPSSHPLEFRPHGPAPIFQPRESYSILSALRSPMVLMMVVSLGLVFVLPKMMNNMDPEAMKEMQDMQTQDPQQLLSSIWGSKEDEDDD